VQTKADITQSQFGEISRIIMARLRLRLQIEHELDEAESAVGIGIVKAIETYDPKRGMSFRNWAVRSGYCTAISVLASSEVAVIRRPKYKVRPIPVTSLFTHNHRETGVPPNLTMDLFASKTQNYTWEDLEDAFKSPERGRKLTGCVRTDPDFLHIFMRRLFGMLTELEGWSLWLFLQGRMYEDIAKDVRVMGIKTTCKGVDNALCRVRLKAHTLEEKLMKASKDTSNGKDTRWRPYHEAFPPIQRQKAA
jgi:hypothetical protein